MESNALVWFYLIIVSATVLVGIVIFYKIAVIAFSKTEKGGATSFGLLFARANILRLTTVVIIIISIVFLALVGRLSDSIIAVFSGIAGYVLGGLDQQTTGDKKKFNHENDPKE